MTFSGGVAGTEGIIHTGIGPFDIQSGSRLGYFTASISRARAAWRSSRTCWTADAANLLSRGPDRPRSCWRSRPRPSTSRRRGTRHRHAHVADLRRQLPAQHLRLVDGAQRRQPQRGRRLRPGRDLPDRVPASWSGGRVDKFVNIDAVFSPRLAFMMKPQADHAFRVSFNRAFRAPSVINKHLDATVILNQAT